MLFFLQSYTSLYSLYTFDWHHPNPPTALVNDTPIIKNLFVALNSLQSLGIPTLPRGDQGIPVVPLLRAALDAFEHLEKHRGRALGVNLRRRHLILLLRSPFATLEPLGAEAAVLSGEAVAETPSEGSKPDAEVSPTRAEKAGDRGGARKGVLANLRELRVAMSVFSPCEDKNLRPLAQMCNMLPPDVRRDYEWPTVIFSREVSQVSSLAKRQSNGPAATRRAFPPPPSPQQQQQQQLLQQRLQQTPPQPSSALGSTEPSPRNPSQSQQQQQQGILMPHQQQGVPTMRQMVGDSTVPSPHQPRMVRLSFNPFSE